jgi:hypothetical protein
MLEVADPYQELSEGDAIGVIDRFALQHRLPNGKTVLDQFLGSRPDLTAADREMLRGWRDPVEGIFEIRRKDLDALVLLNLIDDLEYRAYSSMGPAAFRQLPRRGFVRARLVPICPVPGAWLVSGSMSAYSKSGAAQIAQAALELATRLPELAYRNPGKSSRPGSRCGRTGPHSWTSSAATSWSSRPLRPRTGSTPTTVTGRRPRSPGGPRGAGHGTSPAWTCPPSSSRRNWPMQAPSA